MRPAETVIALAGRCRRLIAPSAAGAWLIIAFMDVTEDFISLKYKTDVQDNLHARRIRTQALVFKRIVTVVVGLADFAIMLMIAWRVIQFWTGYFKQIQDVGGF